MNNFLPNLRVCLLLLCLSFLGGGNSAWAESKTYTIDFNKGTVSGSSISSSLPTRASTLCYSGSTYIASFSGEDSYYKSDGCGIRIAKSTGAGTFTVEFSSAIKAETVEKVVIYASKVLDNNKSMLTVTPSGTVTTATTFANNILPAYDSSKSGSTNYRLADIPINGTLNSLSFYAPSAGYVMLHRISIVTFDTSDTRTPVNITGFTAEETTLTVGNTTRTSVTNDQNGWNASYTYSSDNEAVATVDADGVITAVAKGTANITASLNIANDDANYKRGATSSKAVSITVNNLSHTAHFSVNGTIDPAKDQLVEEGAVVPFPSDPEANGVVFRGWATAAIDGTQDAAPAMITKATETMGVNDVTYYAVFATATDEGDPVSIAGGNMPADVPSGWTSIGIGSYQNGYGIKYDAVGDSIKSPDLSSFNLTRVIVKLKAGHNGGAGSVLRVSTIDASGKIIASGTYKPTDTYTEQTTIEEITLAGSSTIKYVSVKMTSRTSNIGMSYCEIFQDPVTYSNYCTTFTLNPTLSFEANEYWVSAGATIVSPTPTTNTDGAITYAVTSGDAATVDANTGAIALTGTTGDVTITATSAETANYQQGTASYILHVVEPLLLTVTQARYATFAPSQNVELPAAGRDGTIRIYYYTQDPQDDAIAVSSAYEAIGEGGTIARGTGIIVKAEAGTVEFPVNSTVSPTELVGNKLVGVLENTPRDGKENAYIFKNGSQGIGFYPWLSGTLAAGKCYLQLSDHQAPTFIGLEDEETDVHALPEADASMPQTTEIYNLVGLRIRQMQRGMNIVNGKKVLK